MKKRSHGEGSIHQLPSGKYRAQVTIQGHRLSFTGKTARECQNWIRKTQDQIEKGLTYDSARTTFGEFITAWLANKKTVLRPRTHYQYNKYTNKHIIPKLGTVKLKDLKPERIQRFYDGLSEEGVGQGPIQLIHAIIHGCLEHACTLGLLVRNPSQAMIVPKAEVHEMKVWDESQVSQFLVSIRGHPYENLYYLAIITGMRQSELMGLQWKDIDWTKKTLKVQRQVYWLPGGGFTFNSPKTRNGVRVIDLGDQAITLLRNQIGNVDLMRRFVKDRWQEHDLVFPSRTGSPRSKDHTTREFNNLVKKAGLPTIRFHDLRHTAASLMLNHGVSVIVVSRILGHSKASMTLDHYGHLIPGFGREAAEKMDEIIPLVVDLQSLSGAGISGL